MSQQNAEVKNETVGSALGKLAKSPAFVVAGIILLAAAIGLNGATTALSLNFKKQAVPLRKAVAELPKEMGPWRQVTKDKPLSGDIEHVLGTEKYIFREYADTRIVPVSRLGNFAEMSSEDCDVLVYGRSEQRDPKTGVVLKQAVRGLIQDYPNGFIRLSLTYYTGMVDTVAHIPERCFTADGNQSTFEAWPRLKVAGMNIDKEGYRIGEDGMRVSEPGVKADEPNSGLPVRQLLFEDQDNRGASVKTQSVAYVFHVNGRYEANALGVRQSLQNLLESRGYYAKVETLSLLKDPTAAAALNADFLSSALPEVEKCLPDWAAPMAGNKSE